MSKKNPYANPLFVLEELMQALHSKDETLSEAIDRLTALTGISRQTLIDTANSAHVHIAQVNSIPDAVIHLDSNLFIRKWHPSAEKIYGYTSEEAVGQCIEDLLATEYVIDSRHQSMRSFRKHGKWTGELRHRRKDGIYIPVYVQTAFMYNYRGIVTGSVAILRDISGNIPSGNLPELMTTRLRTMLKATNDAIWDWDFRTDKLWWSEGIERLFGYEPSKLEPGPESWYNRVHPEEKERVIDGIHKAINGSASYWQDDYRFLKADGTWAYVFDRGHVIRDQDGMALRMIGGISDRTEHRKMFYELADLNRRLKSHLDISPLAVIEWDADFNRVSWNRRAEEIFGWTADEVIGNNLHSWNFIHEDDMEMVLEAMQKLISGSKLSNRVVNRNYRKDGSIVTCEWYNTALYDDNDNRISYLSLAQDITDRIAAEEALRQSKQRLANALRLARIGDWEADMATLKSDWSDEVFQIYGIQRPENDVDCMNEFDRRVHPDDRHKIPAFRKQILESMKTEELIHRFIRDDGEVRYLHQFAEAIRDKDGKPVKVVGTVQDVTDMTTARMKLEQGENMASTLLESKVMLQNKQLALEEVHHRVKNNLQMITGLMQLQAMKVTDETVRTLFEDSHSRILSMALVQDDLNGNGGPPDTDMGDYLEKLTGNLARVFTGKPVEISVEARGIRLGTALAIPLGLIVNELVTNALRHAFPDGREGTIAVELRRLQNGRFELVVRDDGVGFEGDGGTNRGMGLELVDGLVRQIGGEVVFKRDGGTVVKVEFQG